jgi:ABC-type proline/glycine betaine transport system ATPase subunit
VRYSLPKKDCESEEKQTLGHKVTNLKVGQVYENKNTQVQSAPENEKIPEYTSEQNVKQNSLNSVNVKQNSLNSVNVNQNSLNSVNVKQNSLNSVNVKQNSMNSVNVKQNSLNSVDFNHNPYNMPYYKE